MYSYIWDSETHGYILQTQTGKFVANEIRPVFPEELELLNWNDKFIFSHNTSHEHSPLLWAQKNAFFCDGEKVAQLNKIEYDKPLTAEFFFDGKRKLEPVNVDLMLQKNAEIMEALVADTLKRIKEMYAKFGSTIPYIAFSGGKDSVVLLDLCHRVLPLNVPAIFSDTDMELPSTYEVYHEIQKQYLDRPFIKVRADKSALKNWKLFAPPSRVLRWCCSVHKSAPAILYLRNLLTSVRNQLTQKFLCFVGVRGDESIRRSEYEDIGEGKKISNQVQCMPILDWSAHELWLYIFQEKLLINKAYKKGLQRVGCVLCPMSNDRHTLWCEKLYPKVIAPFAKEIIRQSNRQFKTKEDANDFVYHGGWHARNNGIFLKELIDIPQTEQQDGRLILTLHRKSGTLLRPVVAFFEWLKILGRIEKTADDSYNLFVRQMVIDFHVIALKHSTQIIFNVSDKKIISHLRKIHYKAVSCVACRTCEAECSRCAITFVPQFHINEQKCSHCLKCNQLYNGCLRFNSKRNARGLTMTISGVGNYQTFGLKPEFISELINKRENFEQKTSLGKNMIPSALHWFRESFLIENETAIRPAKLFYVADKLGADNPRLWQFIWQGLVNRSSLVKWFVCSAELNKYIHADELQTKLADSVASAATRKGAISSLKQLLKLSPLGNSESPIVKLATKGNQVLGMTRLSVVPDKIVVLYGLYLMGQLTKRSSFTVREMIGAEFERPCISPLYVFGISPDEFKKICNGLSTTYPVFLQVNFTLGLDEIRISEEKRTDDVLDLLLDDNSKVSSV